jgi:hypothetical protein
MIDGYNSIGFNAAVALGLKAWRRQFSRVRFQTHQNTGARTVAAADAAVAMVIFSKTCRVIPGSQGC